MILKLQILDANMSSFQKLTPVEVVLLGDDFSPVLGAFGCQLLGFVKTANSQCLDVFLKRFLRHLLHTLLHVLEEGLHSRLQVVRSLFRLDDETQTLHSISPAGAAEHYVTWTVRHIARNK